MMKRHIVVSVVTILVLHSCAYDRVEVGMPLPPWTNGELDIHFINTGRGECTYQIFPDGTTFLVDASGSLSNLKKTYLVPSKPSPDISSGKVIVDYINHFAPAESEGHINYFLLTHHHGDHMGSVDSDVPLHESGSFRMSSLPEIGASLVMDKLFDRDYPDFTFPTVASQDTELMNNYRAFLDWTKSVNGTKVEQWKVGSDSQVKPIYNPNCGVSIRNYSGNGRFWTGDGDDSDTKMPTREEFENGDPDAIPSENCYSCSYILSYGDFDFFLGGDLQCVYRDNYTYMDVESQLINVVHKVEVMKAGHHGDINSQSDLFLSVLRPDVWVCCNWGFKNPRPETLDRVIGANPDCEIFFTNILEERIPTYGEERLNKVVSRYGHVVVRVANGGKSYMIYTLEDSDEEYRVKSIHGPYLCAK